MKYAWLALLLALPAAAHAAADTPVGKWHTVDDKTGRERGIVQIQESDGQLIGTILSTTDPAEGRHVCERCSGDQKDKPIIGLTFLWGLHADGTALGWRLDPRSRDRLDLPLQHASGGWRPEPRGARLFGRVAIRPLADVAPGCGVGRRSIARHAGLERVRGIEPLYAAWEAAVLPLNYTRTRRRYRKRPLTAQCGAPSFGVGRRKRPLVICPAGLRRG